MLQKRFLVACSIHTACLVATKYKQASTECLWDETQKDFRRQRTGKCWASQKKCDDAVDESHADKW